MPSVVMIRMSVVFAVYRTYTCDKHVALTQMTTTEVVKDGRGIDKDILTQ